LTIGKGEGVRKKETEKREIRTNTRTFPKSSIILGEDRVTIWREAD